MVREAATKIGLFLVAFAPPPLELSGHRHFFCHKIAKNGFFQNKTRFFADSLIPCSFTIDIQNSVRTRSLVNAGLMFLFLLSYGFSLNVKKYYYTKENFSSGLYVSKCLKYIKYLSPRRPNVE